MTDLDRQVAQTEYVVGRSGVPSYGVRALSYAIDDITRDVGDDLYERMMLDPVVIASVNVLRASILAEGVRCEPAVMDPAADGFELAQEIDSFCDSVLSDLEIPLDDVLWDLLLAVGLGSRVAESKYALQGGKLILESVKVKPRRATAFVVDPYNTVIGLAGQQVGMASVLWAGSMLTTDPAASPEILPREKFVILTFRPRDSDPRGSSVLRPSYGPWWAKQQTWPELLKFLAQFASPGLVGKTAEKAEPYRQLNEDGTYTLIPPTTALRTAMETWRNGGVLAVPYGTAIDALKVSGEGGSFFTAFEFYDRQIVMAILHQTLATLEGQHQTRAASETHKDILGTIIRQARRAVARTIRRDILRPLVRFNFGDRAIPLTPMVSLGEVEQVDMAAMTKAIADLARAQYLDPSQFAGIDRMLGLPPREEPEELDADGKRPDGSAGTSVSPMDEDPSLTNTRAAATGTLIRAGFDPNDARAVTGLPPIRHSGGRPVTIREETKDGE